MFFDNDCNLGEYTRGKFLIKGSINLERKLEEYVRDLLSR